MGGGEFDLRAEQIDSIAWHPDMRRRAVLRSRSSTRIDSAPRCFAAVPSSEAAVEAISERGGVFATSPLLGAQDGGGKRQGADIMRRTQEAQRRNDASRREEVVMYGLLARSGPVDESLPLQLHRVINYEKILSSLAWSPVVMNACVVTVPNVGSRSGLPWSGDYSNSLPRWPCLLGTTTTVSISQTKDDFLRATMRNAKEAP
ncbi:hypothetical protein VTK73DRAFT_4843 [Phialemonium thermophilum]|uniref:Uncharacterized protein n=1 Tax=Phialemonium thermophilum TaxID=223376 RepID=A0ABR3V5J6_9PEZI